MVVPWRPAASLPVLHAQLMRGSRAAPPATPGSAWGLVGDRQHLLDEQRTGNFSGHNPHDFSFGLQVVTAADFPHAPSLGLDSRAVLDDIRRSQDDRALYGIAQGQMFSSYPAHGYPAWTWRPGQGHFDHGHLSVVQSARADDTRPWQTIGAHDMDLKEVGGIVPGITNAQALRDIWVWVATVRGLGGATGGVRKDDRFSAQTLNEWLSSKLAGGIDTDTDGGIDAEALREMIRASVRAELPAAVKEAVTELLGEVAARLLTD